jgi:hypothetical protein
MARQHRIHHRPEPYQAAQQPGDFQQKRPHEIAGDRPFVDRPFVDWPFVDWPFVDRRLVARIRCRLR